MALEGAGGCDVSLIMRAVGDRRKAAVEMLRDIAARLENVDDTPSEPVGCFVQLYAASGEVHRERNIEPGFNLLHAVGVFEAIKADLLDEIRGKE